MHLGHSLRARLTGLGQVLFETGHPGLKFQYTLHSRQVHPLRGQVGYPLEQCNVGLAVPAVAAGGPGRIDKAPSLVDAQGLWMHP